MTPNQIQTPKTLIYNTKHIKHTKLHFHKYKLFKSPHFAKFRHSFDSVFSAYSYGPPLAGLKIEYIYIYIYVYM